MCNQIILVMKKLLNEMEYELFRRDSHSVNVMVTVFAGHNIENKENLGISGLIEAILLRRGEGRITASYGGLVTSYFIDADVNQWQEALEFLGKILKTREFTQEELDFCRDDIIRHTLDRKPLIGRQMDLLYKHTAYATADINWDTDGYIASLKRFTPEDLRQFMDVYYVSANMQIHICTPVKIEATEIEKAFVGMPIGERKVYQRDLYTGGFARLPLIDKQVVYLGFDLTQVVRKAELSVLMMVLQMRLERILAGRGITPEVKLTGYYGRRTLRIDLTAPLGIDMVGALAEVCAQLLRLRREEVNDRRLETAKNCALTSSVRIFEEVGSSLRELEWHLLAKGDEHRSFSEIVMALKDVTSRDLLDLAQVVFTTRPTLVCSCQQEDVSYEHICTLLA